MGPWEPLSPPPRGRTSPASWSDRPTARRRSEARRSGARSRPLGPQVNAVPVTLLRRLAHRLPSSMRLGTACSTDGFEDDSGVKLRSRKGVSGLSRRARRPGLAPRSVPGEPHRAGDRGNTAWSGVRLLSLPPCMSVSRTVRPSPSPRAVEARGSSGSGSLGERNIRARTRVLSRLGASLRSCRR